MRLLTNVSDSTVAMCEFNGFRDVIQLDIFSVLAAETLPYKINPLDYRTVPVSTNHNQRLCWLCYQIGRQPFK